MDDVSSETFFAPNSIRVVLFFRTLVCLLPLPSFGKNVYIYISLVSLVVSDSLVKPSQSYIKTNHLGSQLTVFSESDNLVQYRICGASASQVFRTESKTLDRIDSVLSQRTDKTDPNDTIFTFLCYAESE